MDLALLPIVSGVGALTGGGASFLGAVYTQRRRDRHKRISLEAAKREAVYAEFVMHGSNLLLRAYTQDDLVLTGDEQRLLGLINGMRLFAPPEVIASAEAVLRATIEISLEPRVELRDLATQALSRGLDRDPLLDFSRVCRADLDSVRRTVD